MAVNSFNAQNPPVTTKGDVFTFSTIPTRLGVGANNTVLTADSSTATGLKWASPTSGITGYTLLNAGGTSLSGATTITVSGISAKALMVIVENASSADASSNFSFRLNGDTAANYTYAGFFLAPGSTYAANLSMGDASYSGITSLPFASMSGSATSKAFGSLAVGLADTTGWKNVSVIGGAESDGSNLQRMRANQGIYEASAAITSVSVVSSTGNFDNGTIYVLGAN